MGAILGAIGVGINALSTVAGISSGASSARAQRQAIADQELLARDRLTLLKENFDFSKEWAQQAAQQEMATLKATKAQALQAVTEQVLNNRLALTQARLEAKGIKSQTTQAVAKLLGDAYAVQAQTNLTAANNLEAGVGGLKQAEQELSKARTGDATNETVSSLSKSGLTQQEAFANSAIAGLTRLQENILSEGASADQNLRNSKIAANIQQAMGNTAEGYTNSTADLQSQANAAYEPYARRQVNLTTRRNRKGILAKQYTTAASASANYAANVAGERSNLAQLSAQRAQIPSSNGLLSVLAGVGNIANQGMQLGLFRFGGGGVGSTQSTTTPVSGQGQRSYTMPTTSQLKGIQGYVSGQSANVSPRTYNQYTDVTGNTYG